MKGVFMFGKDNQLALAPIGVMHIRIGLENRRKFLPFAVLIAVNHQTGIFLQLLQNQNLCFQFRNGLRRSGLID